VSDVPNVLVAGATLKCSHQGTASLSSGSDKLGVSGNGAILSGSEVGLSFAGCTAQTPTGGPSPCTTAAPATAGASTVLTVGGLPVLLDTAQGMTANPTPANIAPWSVGNAGQQVLSVSG
jgi:hypothetical protein